MTTAKALMNALDRGRCANSFTDDWFPVGASDTTEAEEYAARQCAGCPVLAECLELALLRGEDFGIWGGTTPSQRRRIRRNRGRHAAAKTQLEGVA